MKFEIVDKETLVKQNQYKYRTEQLYKLILQVYLDNYVNTFKIVDDEKLFSSSSTLKTGVEKAVRLVKRDLPKILLPDIEMFYRVMNMDKTFRVFTHNQEVYLEINRFTKEQLEEIKTKSRNYEQNERRIFRGK